MASKLAELEALLYVAGDNGLKQDSLCDLMAIERPALRELSGKLSKKLAADPDCGLKLQQLGSTFKLTSRPEMAPVIENYFQKDSSKKLSQSALEILAIIAYKQPITRVEIDQIRGVNSAGALQTLVWRDLIKTNGVKQTVGHPHLYVTTDYFLQYFGYQSLADLPVIEDFAEDGFDQEGQVDLFSSRGQADKNIKEIKKDEKK